MKPFSHRLLGKLAQVFKAERGIGVDLEGCSDGGLAPPILVRRHGAALDQPLTEPALGRPGRSLPRNRFDRRDPNLSVGRGTDTPFEQLGAPWIDGGDLAAALSARGLDGVRFYPVEFTPESSTYAGEMCEGVRITVTNRDALRPVRVGLEIASALHRLYPTEYDLDGATRLLGSQQTLDRVEAGDDPSDIAAGWDDGEREWRERVAPYLLCEP